MTYKFSKVLTSLLVAGFIFTSISIEAKSKKPVSKKQTPKPIEVKAVVPAVQDTILAEGQNIKITKRDLRERLAKIPPMYASRYKTKEGQSQILDMMVVEDLFYQEAIRLGIDQEPTVKKSVESALKNIYTDQFIKKEITSKIVISEKVLNDYYNKNKNNYLVAPKITIIHLQAKNDSVATFISSELNKGKDFTRLIEEYSVNEYSAKKKGIINAIRHNKFITGIGHDPELDELIFATPDTSKVYGPYTTSTGIHFFKKIQHEKEIQKEFAEVKNDIENRVRFSQENELSTAKLNELRTKYSVTFSDSILENTDFAKLSASQNSEIIVNSTNDQIRMTFKQASEVLQQKYQMERLDVTNPKMRLSALKSEIDSRIFYAEAIAKGYEELLKNEPEVIQVKKNTILRELYQREVWDKAITTQADVENYYNTNKKSFSINAYRNIKQFVFADEKSAEKARKKLIKLVKNNKEDKIVDLFNKMSIIKDKDGIIENIYNNKIIPGIGNDENYNKAVWELKVGEVSPILKNTKDQIIVFYITLDSPESAKPLSDPQVKTSVENNAKRIKAQANFEELKTRLREQFKVVVYNDLITQNIPVQELFESAKNAQEACNYKEAIFFYDQIIKEYANGVDDYKAWFMKAFVYSEDIKDNDKALILFEDMIKKWPTGDLNESAQFMIQTIKGDIDPTNILKD